MRSKQLTFTPGFRLGPATARAQVAEMVLERGGAEGGPDNAHRGAAQWLYVLAGSGVAVVEGRRRPLRRGSLVLIEAGERHEIRNTGRALLKTLVFYAPPAYRSNDARLPRGRP